VRKEFYDKIRDVANKVGYSTPAFIIELFNRYGEKLAKEILAERSKSAKVTIETLPRREEAPKPRVETRAQIRFPELQIQFPAPRYFIIDLGAFGKFKVWRDEWALFVFTVESSREPITKAVLDKLPKNLRELFTHMWRHGFIRYDVRAQRWRIVREAFTVTPRYEYE
jgi:hypothetical protein